MTVCAACGHENEAGARFCSQCGAALTKAKTGRREERKVVTVLFADLVGFTSRAEQMDPEDVRALLEPYHAKLRSELERFGGRVEKFIGDAVMAVFGAPIAHEDDPERAVRAALAIRDWVLEQDADLQLRIAVSTGEVLVDLSARPEQGEAMISGDVVNTTARLQSSAPVNGILVGETTYRATRDLIDYQESPAVSAKGKSEPIQVWEVVSARARLGGDVVGELRTPLVGRTRELEALRNAWDRAREEGSAQLVTLVGEPGIGKSRLVYELRQTIEHGGVLTYWRQGRSLPYGEGVTFWALAEMIKAQAGILETDTSEQVASRLAEAVGRLLSDQREAQRLTSHLRPLVGLPADEGLGSDRRNESFAAWRRFFEAMAEQRPLVLVFEDLHWADDNLLDFIEHLVDWASGVPLFVVCTTRPELLDGRSGWTAGGRNAVMIALSPLSDDETAALVAALLERPLLAAETQQTVLARAGGNPLYAEQFVRMLAERQESEDLPLPETVQGLIAARLDGLAPDDKALLQDAAVIGKVFWTGAVLLLTPRDAQEAEERLHALERKEFVQRARRSSVSDETEYAFRHLLVRDVAYGQIPRAARADKHRRAAEWIAALGRPEDHAEMLAHHYSGALGYARAAGQDVAGLVEPARSALRTAGDRAMALNAFPEAAGYYKSALALWPEDDPARPALLLSCARALFWMDESDEALLAEARDALIAGEQAAAAAEAAVLIADMYRRRGERARSLPYAEQAAALVADAEPSRSKAYVLGQIARFHMLASEDASAIEAAREAVTMASELRLPEIEAHALCTLGASRGSRGDAAGRQDLEQSIEIAERIDSPEVTRGYTCLADLVGNDGDLQRRFELLVTAQQNCKRLGDRQGLRHLHGMLVQDYYWAGGWDEALALSEDAIADIEAGSRSFSLIEGYNVRARIRLARNDLDGALADVGRALELAREAADPQVLYPVLGFSASAFCSAGRQSDAESIAEELIAAWRGSRRWLYRASSVELAFALAELERPDLLLDALADPHQPTPLLEGATLYLKGEFERAADIYAEIGTKPDEARARLAAAADHLEQGRRLAADGQLGLALSFFRSVGAARYVSAGEALLAATA